ncbi:hypothetical protein D3C78_1190350 [compost metagenome]
MQMRKGFQPECGLQQAAHDFVHDAPVVAGAVECIENKQGIAVLTSKFLIGLHHQPGNIFRVLLQPFDPGWPSRGW